MIIGMWGEVIAIHYTGHSCSHTPIASNVAHQKQAQPTFKVDEVMIVRYAIGLECAGDHGPLVTIVGHHALTGNTPGIRGCQVQWTGVKLGKLWILRVCSKSRKGQKQYGEKAFQ